MSSSFDAVLLALEYAVGVFWGIVASRGICIPHNVEEEEFRGMRLWISDSRACFAPRCGPKANKVATLSRRAAQWLSAGQA